MQQRCAGTGRMEGGRRTCIGGRRARAPTPARHSRVCDGGVGGGASSRASGKVAPSWGGREKVGPQRARPARRGGRAYEWTGVDSIPLQGARHRRPLRRGGVASIRVGRRHRPPATAQRRGGARGQTRPSAPPSAGRARAGRTRRRDADGRGPTSLGTIFQSYPARFSNRTPTGGLSVRPRSTTRPAGREGVGGRSRRAGAPRPSSPSRTTSVETEQRRTVMDSRGCWLASTSRPAAPPTADGGRRRCRAPTRPAARRAWGLG